MIDGFSNPHPESESRDAIPSKNFVYARIFFLEISVVMNISEN